VEFPIDSFDMADYCKELANESKKGTSYSLYAVSNHVGSLSGGHYTAFCKNPISQEWYLFDDRDVAKIENKKHIIGSAAYVLFYKLNS
jgi:ubiquitin C-terminal hydrolase